MSSTSLGLCAYSLPARGLCRIAAFAVIVSGLVIDSGCATAHRVTFNRADQLHAVIPHVAASRFWSDSLDDDKDSLPPHRAGEPMTVLALSGGSDDGAYGAGFLNGWTRSGVRPEFTIVTGVSTGSLIAPFAFLGSAYDAQLTAAYTKTDAHDVYHTRFPLAIPFATSVATTKPLSHLIRAYYTDAVIDAVASQHRRGRRLFVGTTNLGRTKKCDLEYGRNCFFGFPRPLCLVSPSVARVIVSSWVVSARYL